MSRRGSRLPALGSALAPPPEPCQPPSPRSSPTSIALGRSRPGASPGRLRSRPYAPIWPGVARWSGTNA
eukprot:139447-Alexandrium_andersonii.AAC.1